MKKTAANNDIDFEMISGNLKSAENDIESQPLLMMITLYGLAFGAFFIGTNQQIINEIVLIDFKFCK